MRKESLRGARVAQFRVPLWLFAVALIPVGAVFLTSLIIALGVAALGIAAFAFLGPLFFGAARSDAPSVVRGAEEGGPVEIELDRSQYRNVTKVAGPAERED